MSACRIAVLSALETERRCVSDFAGRAMVSHACGVGCRGVAIESLFSGLVSDGVAGVISFGFAGGLAPKVMCGTVLLPDAVADSAGVIEGGIDLDWRARLYDSVDRDVFTIAPSPCLLWSGGHFYRTSAAKRSLHKTSRAVGVDMESGILCRLARTHGVPFLVIRVVSDDGGQDLPTFLTKSTGDMGMGSFLLRSFFSPSDWLRSYRLARSGYMARRVLRDFAQHMAPDFGFRHE